MQISRHWRMNSNRYRLEGVRYENGAVSIQERPTLTTHTNIKDENVSKTQENSKTAQPA